MHLGHLGVPVANRIGQHRRGARSTEKDLVGNGLGCPVPVIARQQDLVTLRVDGVHAETPPGGGHRLDQPGGEPARDVLHDVRGQQVIEQLAPCRVLMVEGDDHTLAAVTRLHVGDVSVARRVDGSGLGEHLLPQVGEIIGADGCVIGPLCLGTDRVGDRERFLAGFLGRDQQCRVHLPARAGGGRRIGHRTERAGQHQRTDRGVHRRLIGQQMRVEARSDRIDAHHNLLFLGWWRCGRACCLAALHGRRCADRAPGEEHHTEHCTQSQAR
ncbi:Uncharacterised protein [Mycobacteroides abscessus subsp. massiliense]|nr:Uncharacterised protein [Mycobacteroides abscessus subsp. massiliense]